MAFHSVLVAADLRRRADPPIESGARLARLTGAQLHVLHCTGGEAETAAAMEMLAEAAPANAGLAVRVGDPHSQIARHAVECGAEVLVLGPRVERSPVDGLLGTTADRVIRASSIPCLLCNDTLPTDPARVLVALDRSVPARNAFRVTSRLLPKLARLDTEGVKVHLVTISAFAQPGRRWAQLVDLPAYAKQLHAVAPAATVTHGVLSAAFPAEGILSCAESFAPDLLIMGTHGSGVLGRLLMGSVAQAVAREAAVPLLLVPPKPRAGSAAPA